MREFIVQTDMDLNGVVEFEGAGGVTFKPKEEIIRCKDCRFYKTHYWNEETRLCDFGMPPRADGFCSWAWTGRKEE